MRSVFKLTSAALFALASVLLILAAVATEAQAFPPVPVCAKTRNSNNVWYCPYVAQCDPDQYCDKVFVWGQWSSCDCLD